MTFWPISLNLFIGFHYFCIFKLHLWSITIITQWKFWQKYFWPFFDQNLSVLTQKFTFLPIWSKDFAIFAYSNYYYGLLLELTSENFDNKYFHPFMALFYLFYLISFCYFVFTRVISDFRAYAERPQHCTLVLLSSVHLSQKYPPDPYVFLWISKEDQRLFWNFRFFPYNGAIFNSNSEKRNIAQ